MRPTSKCIALCAACCSALSALYFLIDQVNVLKTEEPKGFPHNILQDEFNAKESKKEQRTDFTDDTYGTEHLSSNRPRHNISESKLRPNQSQACLNDIDIFNRDCIEFVVRTTCNGNFIDIMKKWLYKSIRLFWYKSSDLNLKIVLNAEEEELDAHCIDDLKSTWPFPHVGYRSRGNNPMIYDNIDRRRMYWDYFYPESYTNAKYVGFLDTDTMFVTPMIKQTVFDHHNLPIINAKVGEGHPRYACWSDATEFMLGKKEAVQCMSYFPVIFQVEDIIEARTFIEQYHSASFDEVFTESFDNGDCLCQFNVLCNYLWYYKRDRYHWHLLLYPNGSWNGENKRMSQVHLSYLLSLDKKYFKPKPRVSIHARYDRGLISRDVLHDEDVVKQLSSILIEGMCFAYGFQICPQKCNRFRSSEIQKSLFTFEDMEWLFDERCLNQQKFHFDYIKRYMKQNNATLDCITLGFDVV